MMLAFPSALSLAPVRSRGLFDDHFLLGDSFFGDFFNFPRHGDFVQSSPGPAAYCRVLEKGLEIELEVPRFRKENIKVEPDERTGRLLISGKRESPKEGKGTLHVAGTSVPSFRRVFTVDPRVYDLKKIATNVEDGILNVTIPYVETKVAIERPPEVQQKEKAALQTPSGAADASNEGPIQVTRSPSVGSSAPSGTSTGEENANAVTSGSSAVAETKKPGGEVAEQGRQQLVDVFRWPPKLDIVPKSESGPLTYTITMPPGVSEPNISLHVVQPGLLCLDVNHTSKSENEFGFNEQRLSFSRTIPMPEGITRENVTASLKDGKLVIAVKEGSQ